MAVEGECHGTTRWRHNTVVQQVMIIDERVAASPADQPLGNAWHADLDKHQGDEHWRCAMWLQAWPSLEFCNRCIIQGPSRWTTDIEMEHTWTMISTGFHILVRGAVEGAAPAVKLAA